MLDIIKIISRLTLVSSIALSAFASPHFTITDLGTLGGPSSDARAINSSGQIVGRAMNADGNYHAVLWSNGTITDLGTLGGIESVANAINDSGQIAGVSVLASPAQGFQSFYLSGNSMTEISIGFSSYAYGINSSGVVAGYGDLTDPHSYIWSNGTLTDLGKLTFNGSQAAAINDHGDIAGGAYLNDDSPSAFMLSNGFLTTFGKGTWAMDINNNDQVVGYSPVGRGYDAGIWTDSVFTDFGTDGWSLSEAYAVNDTGEAVGLLADSSYQNLHAFFYTDGQLFDLNDLIPQGSNWTLELAHNLNNSDQIVGYGTNPQGLTHAFLLTPVPEPSTAAAALATIMLLRRRPKPHPLARYSGRGQG